MPNGYTADLHDGKDVTLRSYLMGVGRSMGFAIMQRDDAMGLPVQPVSASTTYYDEQLAKARATLAQLPTLSAQDCTYRANAEYNVAERAWRESRADSIAMRARYEAMKEKVAAWTPPPAVPQVKEVALRYLDESIQFDCPVDRDDSHKPTRLTGEEWRAAQWKRAERDIEYHTRMRDEEIERTDARNAAIVSFLDSLPEA